MLKSPSALLFSAAVFSTASHAVILDQQWGSWFGTISAMEFEINTDNASNERLTLKDAYEDEFFSIRYFQKGTAHMTFKRLELIERMNDIIAKYYPGMLAKPR